ncbi:RHS repeat-associated core domain-containing protein [Acidovorax sacchari]
MEVEFDSPSKAIDAAIAMYQTHACHKKDDGTTECYAAGPVQTSNVNVNGRPEKYFSLASNEPQRENTYAAIAEIGLRCPIVYLDANQGFQKLVMRAESISNGRSVYCELQLPEAQPCDDCQSVHGAFHPGTGQNIHKELDYSGGSGLEFSRIYRSDVGQFSSMINERWIDKLDNPEDKRCIWGYLRDAKGAFKQQCFTIVPMGNGVNPQVYVWKTGEGRVKLFQKNAAGIVPYKPDMADRVWELSGTGTDRWMVYSGGKEIRAFNKAGRLTRRMNIDGSMDVRLNYPAEEELIVGPEYVSDSFGRSLRFSYVNGLLDGVIDPAGGEYKYSYDDLGNLLSVAYPDGYKKNYRYGAAGDEAGCGHDAKVRNLLVGVDDESGNVQKRFGYDCSGRVISFDSDAANGYKVNYTGAGRELIGPLGEVVNYDYQQIESTPWLARVDRKDVTSGVSYTMQRQYDGKANLLSQIDYSGNQDCYLYGPRKAGPLVTVRGVSSGTSCYYIFSNDGYLPAGAVKISTQWHPDWALPVAIAEPLRITYLIFNGQQDPKTGEVLNCAPSQAVLPNGMPFAVLCKKIEVTTKDGSGAAGFAADVSTDRSEKVWLYSYNEFGKVISQDYPNGLKISFLYYENTGDSYFKGDVKSVANNIGQATNYLAYDKNGRVLLTSAANGLLSSYQYDARGRLTRLQRGDLVALYTYHPTGQLATAATPDGYQVSYAYDAAQRLTDWSDNRGASATYTLDGMGNRVTERIADAQGRAAWQLARSINSLNRVERVSVGGADSGLAATTTGFGYDANGDLVRSTETLDGVARNTTLALDALRRVKSITNAQNATATLAYDGQDAVTKATDFKGVATSYTRDAQGNALQESTPDAGTLATTYDALGLPKSITDALGRATAITRDALGRPTQIVSSAAGGGASRTTVLRYDLPGAEYNAEGAPQASVGSLSEIQEAEVTTRYQRDLLGRITRKTEILANGDTRTLGYRYVPAGGAGAGQVAAIIYPSGRQLQHQYDTTGQLTGLQWNGQPLLSSITWNPLGQPTAWQWSGGLGTAQAEQRSYTTAGQLASSRLLPQLVWDGAGRVARMLQRHALPGMGTLAQDIALASVFTYDAAGRLTASAHSAPADLALPQGWGLGDTLGATASGYAWDANGNRTQVHHTSATGAGAATLERVFAQSADSNRLQGYTERFTPAGGAVQTTQVAYSQDAAGALTKKGDTYLHYGVDGRIVKVGASADASDALAVGYVTNALGQRVLKRDARLSGQDHPAITQQTVYAEDGIGSTVLGQYGNRRSSDSAAPAGEMDSTEVIWLPTATGPMPVAAQINGRLYAIDADHLNTPRRLTNAQGQVVWQWLIAGFGEANPTTGATGYAQEGAASGRSYGEAVRFDLRYPGQSWDEETGLSYNLHRYYDAGTGRYVQADPIGLEGGWNRFGYVEADPLNARDPDGLHPLLMGMANAAVRVYGAAQGALYRYAPALTEFIAGASGVNGTVVAPMSPLVAQIPTAVSRMTPVAQGIAQGVESGAYCAPAALATSGLEPSAILLSAQQVYKGSTVVGHALSKHAGRNPGRWGVMTGSMKTWNDQGVAHLNDVLRGPGAFAQVNSNGIYFLEKRLGDGRGVRLNMDGSFKGFLD